MFNRLPKGEKEGQRRSGEQGRKEDKKRSEIYFIYQSQLKEMYETIQVNIQLKGRVQQF